jgi:hypothetical protein
MCYTTYGCGCGCVSPCGCCSTITTTTSTTTTTTINPNCEICDEFYDCNCIISNDDALICYGLKSGDTLCKLLEVVIQNLPLCVPVVPIDACTFTGTITL